MPDTPLLSLLDAGLRGTLIALLVVLATVLHRDRPRLAAARAGVALCLGLVVQTFSSAPAFEAHAPLLLQVPLVAVSVGNAVLFWIFVQALFDDDFRWHPVHAAAWCTAALLAGFNCLVVAGSASVLAPITYGLQRSVPVVCAVLAAMAAARHWRADLVDSRRRLRAFIAVAGVVYTLAQLVARLASPQGRLVGATATADVLLMLVIVLPAAWFVLCLRRTDLFPSDRAAAPTRAAAEPPVTRPPLLTEPDPAEERLALSLNRLMAEDHAYRSEDLSVASLAARLAVPEYRLRRLINQRLGHCNFNAYVNGLRLEEACAALANPALRERPVLSIALDAGFQSIGPFNRSFKAATGFTPTDFRKQKLADS